MKKRSFILSSLLIFSLTSLVSAQTITISGSQTAGTGVLHEAKLESKPVELESSGSIIRVEGGSAGFWINRVRLGGENTIARFFRPNEAIGYSLGIGTYTVYPNILEGVSSARVKIYVESEK